MSLLGILYVLMACSTAENYELLSFFFDGVPDPLADKVALHPDDSFVGPRLPDATEEQASQQAPRGTVHQPYADRACEECHVIGSRGKNKRRGMMQGLPRMRAARDKLCFVCHEVAPRKWAHAPAVAGACTLCHTAHKSLHPSLLLRADQKEICGQCHEGETFPSAARHAEFGVRICSDCHDPHAADGPFFLRDKWESGAMESHPDSILLKAGKKKGS